MSAFRAITAASMLLFFVGIKPMTATPNYSFKNVSMAGVTIIKPGSPEFLPAVALLADRTVMSSIQPVLPFSYILKNTSNKSIIVYSTRWTLTDSAGNITKQDRTWWNLSTLQGGDAIAPGASRLVTPIFRLGVTKAGPTGPALSRQLQHTLAAFTSKAKVETSVETVIFEDGTALGTDATNATAQAQAYLDAERQLADDFTSGATTHVAQSPSSRATGPRTYRMSDPPQYEDSLALYRQSFTSALEKQMQLTSMSTTSLSAASWLDKFQENVAAKRNLNIVRQ